VPLLHPAPLFTGQGLTGFLSPRGLILGNEIGGRKVLRILRKATQQSEPSDPWDIDMSHVMLQYKVKLTIMMPASEERHGRNPSPFGAIVNWSVSQASAC
jgi:hypothetical protein